MNKVQQSGEYSIYRKRSGRYAVRNKEKQWVNAEEKTKILLEAGLIKIPAPKPARPEEAPETASEDAAAGGEPDS